MSDNNNNNIRQSAESLLRRELRSYCKSESLSEDGMRQIIERHGLTHNNNSHHDVGNYKFFFKACRNRRVTEGIIRFLLERFPAAISAIDDDGWSPLHYACRNPNMTLNIVQLLIDAAPESVQSKDQDGYTPLHNLCRNEELDERAALAILKLLIEKHPDSIRHADNDGGFPIHCAAYGEKTPEFCRELIKAYPGSERVTDANGVLPLHYTCGYNTLATVEYLYKLFPDAINHATSTGEYPIHYAINKNMTLNIIRLLIDAAPNCVRSQDEDGWMPLHCLCGNENIVDEAAALVILKLLIEKHPDALRHVDNNGCLPIHLASQNKNVTLKIIQLLIDTAPESARSVNQDGHLPLHILCGNRELDERAALEILKLLIEKQPEALRYSDNDGGFPIHCASDGGRSLEFCRVLIEAYPGSEKIMEAGGELPLHHACRNSTLATVEYLYKLYPDAINHAANSNGCYPVHFAIKRSRRRKIPIDTAEIVKFLLDCDVNVKLQMVNGLSLLSFACQREYDDSNIEAALAIIKVIYDAYPEAIEDDDIMSDIENHRYHPQVQTFVISQLVFSLQATDHRLMMTPDKNGQLPLHIALQNDVRLGSIKLLVKGNPSAIRNIDDSGVLPLHVACQHHDSASVVQYLIGLADVTLDATDRQGNTTLHYACRGAKYDTIALLLETYDALSVSKRNAHGKLPIDLLWESSEVLDRESTEYAESVFRLLKVYPETVMNIGMKKYQSASASKNGKKRKFGREE